MVADDEGSAEALPERDVRREAGPAGNESLGDAARCSFVEAFPMRGAGWREGGEEVGRVLLLLWTWMR